MKFVKPIGIFDSGMGGLTILKEIKKALPDYDYLYLGDNARVPYGSRSFETVHEYTWQCVKYLLDQGCPLVIIACNTASAKALRTIQQVDLPREYPDRKVLGVIRPTTEIADQLTNNNKLGIFATQGTVASASYVIEIKKFFPDIDVYQQACPMLVPLIENEEHRDLGADYFVSKYADSIMSQSDKIDAIVLACTHYPLLIDKIRKALPSSVSVISQGSIIAKSLQDYLTRHPEINDQLTKGANLKYLTTDVASLFDLKAKVFMDDVIESEFVTLTRQTSLK